MAKFELSNGSVISLSDRLPLNDQLEFVDSLERDFADEIKNGVQPNFDINPNEKNIQCKNENIDKELCVPVAYLLQGISAKEDSLYEFRNEYPQYSTLSNYELLELIHHNFSPDKSIDEIAHQMGVSGFDLSIYKGMNFADENQDAIATLIAIIFVIAILFFARHKIISGIKSMFEKLKSNWKYIAAIAFVASLYFVFADKNYEDCILSHVKSGMSNDATYVIKDACKKKHGY
jgi:hypothetical protein